MFLHKLDILNRNLNGLIQKFLLVVTKLCAVTILGDLTVLRVSNLDKVGSVDPFRCGCVCQMLIAHSLPIIMLGGWGAESSQVANNHVGRVGC
jgi:hypothetical protein